MLGSLCFSLSPSAQALLRAGSSGHVSRLRGDWVLLRLCYLRISPSLTRKLTGVGMNAAHMALFPPAHFVWGQCGPDIRLGSSRPGGLASPLTLPPSPSLIVLSVSSDTCFLCPLQFLLCPSGPLSPLPAALPVLGPPLHTSPSLMGSLPCPIPPVSPPVRMPQGI